MNNSKKNLMNITATVTHSFKKNGYAPTEELIQKTVSNLANLAVAKTPLIKSPQHINFDIALKRLAGD